MASSSSQLPKAQEPLQKVFAMVKGDGEEKYSKNSGIQAAANKIPLSRLNEALERMTMPSKVGDVVVADLGCSSSPNSIDNVAHIIDKLRLRLPKDSEFQACFNDLPSNDFNNLFQLLSNDSRAKNFFAAGVPGSYFDRLFAQSSVHVFYSSFCLHRLSTIPDAVLDKDSPAYNKGNLWIVHSGSAVAAAYRQQALLDLKKFLLARAAELVPGGLLFFFCCGRSTSEPNDPPHTCLGKFLVGLNEIWSELIAQNLLTEHQRDTFNIPVYLRSIDDVREAIASCGPLFRVLPVEMCRTEVNALEVFATSEATAMSRKLTASLRTIVNNLLEAHVGEKVSEIFWQLYEKSAEKLLGISPQNPMIVDSISIVSLIRT